ncbi:MAG: hypothetical protein A2836_01975 [Candidatus Taylorbacteria bacterium RIFCSPHIGHO2_01_FULL_45_63]|nr:MAG: hypothetical protein A2836_01975 [Candidatus Taylorbacteria bacterium RIFCSPHIGHO2_01_FULL_45_63]OHA34485.1 MAG: hypothetical protein A3A22_02625 [Candidatus Taylorbacteria bacterium RIFCSPLOWO2_01_FULL_45_34b]
MVAGFFLRRSPAASLSALAAGEYVRGGWEGKYMVSCASGISARASMTKGRAPTLSCNTRV